nr:unnamed protein product [Digitaria exilis]
MAKYWKALPRRRPAYGRGWSGYSQPIPDLPHPAAGRLEEHGVALEDDTAEALAAGVLAPGRLRPPRVEQGEPGEVVAVVRPAAPHPPAAAPVAAAAVDDELGDAAARLAVGDAAAGDHAERRQEGAAADSLADELHHLRGEVVLHGSVVGGCLRGHGRAGHRGDGCEGHGHGHGGEACHSWWPPALIWG